MAQVDARDAAPAEPVEQHAATAAALPSVATRSSTPPARRDGSAAERGVRRGERGRRRRRTAPPFPLRRCALSSSAVPSATTRPWSITTIRSASRSASSRYCVVSRTVTPDPASSRDRVPHLAAAARVEAGGRLVEEHHRRHGDQAHREVEAAPHAAGVGARRVGRRRRPGRSARSSSVVRRPAARPRQMSQPAHHQQVLAPVSSSSTAAYWPGQADRRADLVRLVARSCPATVAAPRVGLQQCGEDPNGVVLPAPFGPSSANTDPAPPAGRGRQHGQVAVALRQA